MKKNGFTLLELITVISLLSIVGIILVPKLNSVFQTSKADQLEEVRKKVAVATDIYLNNSCGELKYRYLVDNEIVRIYLKDINNCGFIDDKVYNPVNDSYFNLEYEYVDVLYDEVGMINYKFSF